MVIRRIGLLVALLLVALAQFLPAQAQDSAVQPARQSAQSLTTVGDDYSRECRLHGVRCTLVYGDKTDKPKTEPGTALSPKSPRRQSFDGAEPAISGPVAVVLVLVALAVIIGLAIRFGNGGVLLSSAPRDVKKRQGEAPDSWRMSDAAAEEKPNDFLGRVAAMADRRQALVLLLRHCLLHAADVTGTRLFRSDTERAVFARLPETMPDRERLEYLLSEAELVHYGGRTIAESHFGALLNVARNVLSMGRLSHA